MVRLKIPGADMGRRASQAPVRGVEDVVGGRQPWRPLLLGHS